MDGFGDTFTVLILGYIHVWACVIVWSWSIKYNGFDDYYQRYFSFITCKFITAWANIVRLYRNYNYSHIWMNINHLAK